MLSAVLRSSSLRHLLMAAVAAIHQPLPATPAAKQTGPHLIASPEAGWPQFRGPRRDGICDERGLLPSWPESGPKLVWSVANELGNGYSSPIIAGGRMYITGDVGEAVQITAMDLTGKPVWTAKNGASWNEQYPGARASVTYSAGRVYHQNAHGRVACLDAANGRELWALEAIERFGGKNITWGLSESPVVDERAVYLTAGGKDALVVALDKQNGQVLWKSEPLADEEGNGAIENASYASPILVHFAGRRLLVGCSQKYLYGVDIDSGKLQWTHRLPTSYSVLAMTPALVGDGIFMTAPLGKPFGKVRLIAPQGSAGKVSVSPEWTASLDTAHGGVVVVGNKIIGSYYSPRKGWAALDANTGEQLYSAPQFIKGSVLYADDRLYALSEDGWMQLLEATDKEFLVHGRFRLVEPKRRDAWAHPVIHEGKLYLRYHDTLHCYDIRQSAP